MNTVERYEEEGEHLIAIAKKLQINLGQLGIFINEISQACRGENQYTNPEHGVEEDEKLFMLGFESCKRSHMDQAMLKNFVSEALKVRENMVQVGIPPFHDEFIKKVTD